MLTTKIYDQQVKTPWQQMHFTGKMHYSAVYFFSDDASSINILLNVFVFGVCGSEGHNVYLLHVNNTTYSPLCDTVGVLKKRRVNRTQNDSVRDSAYPLNWWSTINGNLYCWCQCDQRISILIANEICQITLCRCGKIFKFC